MNRTTRAAGRIAAGLAVATMTLTGCSTDQTSGPGGTENIRTVSEDHRVGVKKVVEKIAGNGEPQNISVLCIDDLAFLYVYTDGGYDDGPAISRFAEQDPLCQDATPSTTSSTTSTAESKEGN